MNLSRLASGDVSEVELQAIQRLTAELGYPSTLDEIPDRLRRILENAAQNAVFLAKSGEGVPVGWVHVRVTDTLASDPRAEITGFVVDSRLRGRGIGTRLIAEAESWAAELGLPLIRLHSNIVRTDAHCFYQRLGYENTKTSALFVKPLT